MRQSPQAGFLLIEALAAVALMGILSAAIVRVMVGHLRLFDRLRTRWRVSSAMGDCMTEVALLGGVGEIPERGGCPAPGIEWEAGEIDGLRVVRIVRRAKGPRDPWRIEQGWPPSRARGGRGHPFQGR